MITLTRPKDGSFLKLGTSPKQEEPDPTELQAPTLTVEAVSPGVNRATVS